MVADCSDEPEDTVLSADVQEITTVKIGMFSLTNVKNIKLSAPCNRYLKLTCQLKMMLAGRIRHLLLIG